MWVSIKICRTIVTPVQVDRSLNLDGSRQGRLAASDHAGPRGPGINRGPRCYGGPKRHQRERSTWHGCLQAWQPGWPSTSRSSICARGEAAMRKRASRRSSFACGDGRARLSLSRQSSRLPLARQRERPALRGPFMQQSQIISDLHCWSRSPECRSAIRSARDQHQRSAQLAPLSATCRSQSATERSDCSDLCWC